MESRVSNIDDVLEQLRNETKPRFIAVVHTWHVHSRGFHVYKLNARTTEQADVEAALLYRKHNVEFTYAAVKVIEIGSNEAIAKNVGRRLTWWERLTGKIQCVHGKQS